jgi:hypothetical protein
MFNMTQKTVDGSGWRSFYLLSVCIAGFVSLLLGSSLFAQDSRQSQITGSTSRVVSQGAQELASTPWADSSFVRAMKIIADRKETHGSRSVAMELLLANRRKNKPAEMRRLLNEITVVAKDSSAEDELRAQAINTLANVTLTMEDLGQLNRAEATKESGFLLSAAVDLRQNIQVRTQAINSLGILKVSEASPILREVLRSSENVNVAEIARPTCLSLMRIDRSRAVPVIADVLHSTNNPLVFGTAAFVLGQINNRESMIALIDNQGRFPESGACDAALVEMENVVLGILKNPQDGSLMGGIQATHHLWRQGQRERYIPPLLRLLTTAPLVARKAALERLMEASSTQEFEKEKQELYTILALIKDQRPLSEYQERILRRLSATVVTPSAGVSGPVPPKHRMEK